MNSYRSERFLRSIAMNWVLDLAANENYIIYEKLISQVCSADLFNTLEIAGIRI